VTPSRTSKSYDEIIDFIAAGTTPQKLIEFRPSQAVQSRVEELIRLSKDGIISADQQSELEDFLELEHLIILAKARARQLTKLAD
jgi:hypothetical protein